MSQSLASRLHSLSRFRVSALNSWSSWIGKPNQGAVSGKIGGRWLHLGFNNSSFNSFVFTVRIILTVLLLRGTLKCLPVLNVLCYGFVQIVQLDTKNLHCLTEPNPLELRVVDGQSLNLSRNQINPSLAISTGSTYFGMMKGENMLENCWLHIVDTTDGLRDAVDDVSGWGSPSQLAPVFDVVNPARIRKNSSITAFYLFQGFYRVIWKVFLQVPSVMEYLTNIKYFLHLVLWDLEPVIEGWDYFPENVLSWSGHQVVEGLEEIGVIYVASVRSD